jgi:hypothetical protein
VSKKEILFSARIDTAEFSSQLRQIQQRVKETQGGGVGGVGSVGSVSQNQIQQRMQTAGMATPGGASALQQDQAYKRSLKEVEALIKNQWTEANKLNKEMENRLKIVEQLKKDSRDELKTEKEKLEILEKLTQEEKEQQRGAREHIVRIGALKKAMDERDDLQQSKPSKWLQVLAGFQGGGVGGAAKAGMEVMGGGVGVGMAALGLISSGISLIDPIRRQRAAQDRIIASAQGSAVQGLAGPLQDLYAGNLSSSMLWAPEKAVAMQRAIAETQTNISQDQYRPWTTVGTAAAGGAALGLGAGAMGAAPTMGLSLPVMTALGGAAGATKGIYDVLSDPMSYNTIMAQMGSKSAQQYVRGQYARDIVTRYNEGETAEKQKNPLKELTEKRYRDEVFQNLEFQRQMGMNDQQLTGKGGFLDRGTAAHFTREAMMGQSSAIMAAGGGTLASRFLAQSANQFTTGGITNAAQLMGQISGNVGGGAGTNEAFIKVLAEGVKKGMNTSDQVNEIRKFAEMATSFAVSTGATTSKGIAAGAREFGEYVGTAPTMAAITAASTASQWMAGATSQTTGPTGSIFAAKMMGNPKFSKLDSDDMIALGKMSTETLMNPDNPIVQQMADKAGMSVDEFQQNVKGVKMESQGGRQKTHQKMMQAEAIIRRHDVSAGPTAPMTKEETNVIGKAEELLANEDTGFANLSPLAQRAAMRYMAQTPGATKEEAAAAGQKATSFAEDPTKTGKIGDTELAGIAKQQEILNQNFRDMKAPLQDAALAASMYTKAIMEQAVVFGDLVKKGNLTPENLQKEMDAHPGLWPKAAPVDTNVPRATRSNPSARGRHEG